MEWPRDSIVQKQDGTISVEWGAAELTDERLEQFIAARLDGLLGLLPCKPDGVSECAVDLSCNQLRGPVPLAMLLQRLREAPLHITTLRLYNNEFDDLAAVSLSEHIWKSSEMGRPLMQLHLSGNALSGKGMEKMVEAAHGCGAYPRPEGAPRLKSLGADGQRRALWLRTEHQKPALEDPQAFLLKCEHAGHSVCVVGKDERAPPKTVVQMHYAFLRPKGEDFGTKGKGKGKAYGKSYGHGGYAGYGGYGGQGGYVGSGRAVEEAWDSSGYPSQAFQSDSRKGEGSGGKGEKSGGKGKGKPGLRAEESLDAAKGKTKMCRFFLEGKCAQGQNCKFAHGKEDLQAGVSSKAPEESAKMWREPTSWLQKLVKERQDGIDFDAAWALWCEEHLLSFREAWDMLHAQKDSQADAPTHDS